MSLLYTGPFAFIKKKVSISCVYVYVCAQCACLVCMEAIGLRGLLGAGNKLRPYIAFYHCILSVSIDKRNLY